MKFVVLFAFISPQSAINQLKLNNKKTRTRCEICSKLAVKKAERRQCRHSGVSIANSKHISHLVLVFLLLTLSRYMPTEIFKDQIKFGVDF